MTEEQLAQKIRDAIKEAGSLRALGEKWNVSAQYLCDLKHGKRRAGDQILKALGLKRETRITTRISHDD